MLDEERGRMQLQQANYLPFTKASVLSSCRLTCHELQSQTLRRCNDLLQLKLLTQEPEISSKNFISTTQRKKLPSSQTRLQMCCLEKG